MGTIRDLVEGRLRASLIASQPGAPENVPIEVVRPQQPEHGDFATNIALQMASRLKAPPRQIAEALVAALNAGPDDDLLLKAETAGPGFVNVWLTPGRVESLVDDIRAAADSYGTSTVAKPEKINVEFVSANPTGPLTVGNARGAFVGDLLCRVLEAVGHQVTREYYFNDSGAQVEKLGLSVLAITKGEPVADDGYHGEYVKDIAAAVPADIAAKAKRRARAGGLDHRGVGLGADPCRDRGAAWSTSASISTSGRPRARCTARAGSRRGSTSSRPPI